MRPIAHVRRGSFRAYISLRDLEADGARSITTVRQRGKGKLMKRLLSRLLLLSVFIAFPAQAVTS